MALPTDGFGVYELVVTLSNSGVYQPRLDAIAAGGFKLVMNYSLLHGHIADVTAYINYAASKGMKVIVALHDPVIWKTSTYSTIYPELYADSSNAATAALFAAYIVNQTKGLAGVWGWYVGDEVVAADHTTFKAYADAIRAADSTHPRLFMAGGFQNSTNSFGSATSTFWDCCEVGGDDYYPLTLATQTVDQAVLATEAAGVLSYCNTKSVGAAMVLQSHSLINYGQPAAPWPSASLMLQMRNTVITNASLRLILWYSYFDVISSTAPLRQWPDVQDVVKAVFGPTFSMVNL